MRADFGMGSARQARYLNGMLRFALCLLLALPAAADPAIGRLNTGGFNTRSSCTGSLVAPDVVLTAAHCVAKADTGVLHNIADMVFVAGWNGERHFGAANVAEVKVHPWAFDIGRLDVYFDLALVRLTAPLEVAPLPIGEADPGAPLTLAGYARTRSHRLTVRTSCVAQPQQTAWTINCQAETGQSGGPVLAGEGDARRIVAVIVARSGFNAIALPTSSWLIETLDAMR